jgi:hypothetical protein
LSRQIDELVGTGDDRLLLEVEVALIEAFRAVETELAALADGKPVACGVAAAVLDGVEGNPGDERRRRSRFSLRSSPSAPAVRAAVCADRASGFTRSKRRLPGRRTIFFR